jgi:hypothetical protein
MSGLLGAGIDVPLSISMTASAGSPINRSATVNTTIMLEDYISKLGLGGIPSSISLNSSGAITPRFGTNSTVTGLASIYNKTTDLVTLCTLIPGVGTYFAYVDPFVDANVSTSLQFQRNDSFTPSSLKGNILVNGSSAGQFALTGATQTVYVDIPQNVGSTVSMDVANLSLANTFNSTLGFNTDAGFQVKVKIPYIASKTLYTLDPPAIFLPVITLPSKTLSFSITDPAAKSIPVESPFSSMPTINSVVQAENFNNGGEGVAYHDMTAGNQGGAYRNTDVDVKLTYDAGTAYCVGNIMNGEWLDYFVNIPSQGRYDVDYRVASSSSANTFSLEANSVAVEDSATDILNTSGKWTTVSTRAALLPAGVVHLRLRVKSTTSGTVALNWLKVRPAALGNHDPNDQLSEANALTVGGSIAGSISTSSDVDMYKFVVPATLVGKNVSVNANKQNPLRPGPAVLLRLFNSAGIELAHSTSKLAPTITYTFKQAGVYFVGVSAAGNHAYNPLTGLLDTGGTPVKSYTLTEVLA